MIIHTIQLSFRSCTDISIASADTATLSPKKRRVWSSCSFTVHLQSLNLITKCQIVTSFWEWRIYEKTRQELDAEGLDDLYNRISMYRASVHMNPTQLLKLREKWWRKEKCLLLFTGRIYICLYFYICIPCNLIRFHFFLFSFRQ